MTLHTFQPTRYYTTLGSHEPVLRIADGDTVETTTVDARGYDARGEEVAARFNAQTGPFYVEGAEPGDTLAVLLERIRPNRTHGWSSTMLAPNVVDPTFVPELPWPADGNQLLAAWHVDAVVGFPAVLVAAQPVQEQTQPATSFRIGPGGAQHLGCQCDRLAVAMDRHADRKDAVDACELVAKGAVDRAA